MADPTTRDELLAPLESPSGGFAMVALDQRESLRRMFPLMDGVEVGDEVLRGFKRDAMRVLSPLASAILVDRPYGVTHDRPTELADGSALILAADDLEQPPGSGVVSSRIDPLVTPEFIRHVGAAAIKLLVIWRPDGREHERERLVRSFVELADESGVASLVEGIVDPVSGTSWTDEAERHAAIIDAARELASYGGTIYKAQVPGYVVGDVSGVRQQAEILSREVPGPWVVLSNGVAQPDFADAVREACLGGAHGFLAGRAIWADIVGDDDPLDALAKRPAERIRSLTEIVAESTRTVIQGRRP